MHFTHDMAEAFGDWLELDRIQDALLDARPELDGAFARDAARPLLRIERPAGGALVVARSAEEGAERWIVGIPGGQSPVLHDVNTLDEVVAIVLHTLQSPPALATF